MLANAGRRASVAKKYDDAVARLYSVLETLARNSLSTQFGIQTDKVQPEQVPEVLRAEYVHLYTNSEAPEDGLKLGLKASYYLLDALGDDLGKKYKDNEKDLNKVLHARNQSRLAHGTNPVRTEVYEKLREILLQFAGVKEDELPVFPEMRL